MIGEPYPFLSENYDKKNDVIFFTFLSQGDEVIPKAIAFTPIEKYSTQYYNWGFGDLVISDQTMEIYRGLIRRHWWQIEPFYEIRGFAKDAIVPYEPGIEFE